MKVGPALAACVAFAIAGGLLLEAREWVAAALCIVLAYRFQFAADRP